MAVRAVVACLLSQQVFAEMHRGSMSMWASTKDTLVGYKSMGSACMFADKKMGGLESVTAQTPYIKAKNYCAVNRGLYGNGEVCGRCYKL
eukprot:CAMPEP_0181437020 /NCGR_PEP_ID=MMETSP1110-20121109/21156_1 /TAXON_ID=174948 /ORGANISM="Symbiodinium sp., Strain CCMP421" /LENGTH=89 /DNA_ID=CAMNT_0023560619 /DNA_START=62 /DNA_END=328 /DNA_ORIENTATION=-